MADLTTDSSWEASTEAGVLIPQKGTPFQMVVRAVGITGGVAAIAINALSVVAFIKGRLDQKSLTNIFITSLNCTDLLCGISGVMVFLASVIRDVYPKRNQNAFIWTLAALITFLFASSLANTFIIGCDRLLATVWPLHYKTIVTRTRVCLAIVIMFVAVFCIFCIPLCVSAASLDTSNTILTILTMDRLQPGKYSEYVIGPFIVLLMLLNCILYSVIFVAFRKSANKVQSTAHLEQRSRRLTRTILLVVLVCWMPTVFFIIFPPTEETGIRAMAYRAGFGLLLVPSCMNNFVYAFRQKEYKTAYMNLLKRSHRVQPQVINIRKTNSKLTSASQKPNATKY